MGLFKRVKVSEVRKETDDSVSIAFDISDELKNDFLYKSGQYITIKHIINGEEIRRSYSLCSAPHENDFRVAVKKIEAGKMSSFLNDGLKTGDVIEVMPPKGSFMLIPSDDKHYVAFAAGSGITPIISMIKAVLSDSNSHFTLYYGNKKDESTIFKSELDLLKKQNAESFTLNYIYTEQESVNKLFEGRISKIKFEEFVRENINILKADAFFMCGPEQMIREVSEGLEYLGVAKEKIHFELFTAPEVENKKTLVLQNDFKGKSHVTVIMDGEEIEFDLDSDGDTILDASMSKGVDAPFSCKGAVCCTCKAQVIEGKATMEMNYSLSDAEVEEGFILTCQSHPASEKLVVDFDVI